jgi:beta-lactam-binding protein with PASTA domain
MSERRPLALRVLGWLAYSGLLLGVFVISGYAAFSASVRSGVTKVPDLLGLTEQEAVDLLLDQGLDVDRAAQGGFDNFLEPGRVLRQKPPGGGFVKKGSEIEITLSLGREQLRMPDLAGQAVTSAQSALSALGLEEPLVAAVFAPGPAGVVVGQDPPGGGLADRSSPSRLLVSQEGLMDAYVMPDVVSRPFEEVRAFFESRGFRLGSAKLEPYEGVAGGTVQRQFPLPGHPLRRHDAVALVVATEAR